MKPVWCYWLWESVLVGCPFYIISTVSFRLEDLQNQSINDREQLERQNQQLSEYEAEINLLRRRVESLENDREKDKKEIARLQDALNRARIVSDNKKL